jgi:glutathione S-transferase
MITVYKFIPAWDVPDLSPFCIKVETYLRMVEQPYQGKLGHPSKAPKGKLPYIEYEGRTISDSSAIIDHFETLSKTPLDHGMSLRDKAASRAFQSMLEEHFYFVAYWQRWGNDAGWAIVRPVIVQYLAQTGVPKWLAPLLANVIRRSSLKGLKAQGIARHTPDEINTIGIKLLTALSHWLGDQPCIMGNAPRTLDASVYAFLTALLGGPIQGPVKSYAQSQANLVAYQKRMQARYW